MLRLMRPCRVSEKEQLEAGISLFKERVGDEYTVGIEAYLRMDDLYDPSVLERAVANIRALQEPIFLSVHGPIELERGSKRNFFTSEEGFNNLVKTVQFAEEIGANLINIHAHLFVGCEELRKAGQSGLGNLKRAAIQKVRSDLQKLRQQIPSRTKICVENVPYCLTTDRTIDPQEALYELCFVEPTDFSEIVNSEENIFATVDICHLAQVYDSSQLLALIQDLGEGLRHVHFSDLQDIWQPLIYMCEEGAILGEGRIGERVLKELLRYFLDFSERQDLGIVLEINDKDHIKLKESRRAFEIVMQWLRELKKS